MNEYFINKGTCAIVPIEEEVSKVIELDGEVIVYKSVKDIMNESCKYYGCSYNGRYEGSKMILNMNYKLPIVVDEISNLIFFPTSSPRFNECIWISLSNILSYSKKSGCSKICFSSGYVFDLKISYYCLETQIFRATMLESLLRRRKNV